MAGLIVTGYGFGPVGNIVVGILGALLGGAILPRLGLFTGGDLVGRDPPEWQRQQIISATLGAVLLLFLIGLVRRTGTASRF